MLGRSLPPMAFALLLVGCTDSTAPRDLTPPAAPRGLFSITGDERVFLEWLGNTEPDLAGYRVYEAPCPAGIDCLYDRVGATNGTRFAVTGLANGETRYYAVTAYDRAGNESDLSEELVFDTPRPEGSGLGLTNYLDDPVGSGYDFSAYSVRPFDHPEVDVFFGSRDGVELMIAPFVDTDIQDAGFAASLDAVDFAPAAGWAPSGTVELIPGHCYVVRTSDLHFAKFWVTDLTPSRVDLDWAYQVDRGNRELSARPVRPAAARVRRPAPWGA